MYVRLDRRTRVVNGLVYPRIHIWMDGEKKALCGRRIRQLTLATDDGLMCKSCEKSRAKRVSDL